MQKTRQSFSVFLGAYLLLVSPFAQAQAALGPGGPNQHEHSEGHIREIFNQLNLTDDQKHELEANKQQHRAKMERERQELKLDRETLRNELMKPHLDMLKVNKIHERIKMTQNQMEDEKLSSILAVRAILTPDQFLKFINMMQKHKEGHLDGRQE